MINWSKIDVVFIDMDGTLLDLHFDNFIWDEIIPQKYSELNQITIDEAKSIIKKHISYNKGTLNAYCFKYWSSILGLDFLEVHNQEKNKIKYRSNAENFLRYLNHKKIRVIIITNADKNNLQLKLLTTTISQYVNEIYTSHEFGYAKEQPEFWINLKKNIDFDPCRTLFIDDNIFVLRTAQRFGLKHLLAINKPSSRCNNTVSSEFISIVDFNQLIK